MNSQATRLQLDAAEVAARDKRHLAARARDLKSHLQKYDDEKELSDEERLKIKKQRAVKALKMKTLREKRYKDEQTKALGGDLDLYKLATCR